jgi:hypothetical protein
MVYGKHEYYLKGKDKIMKETAIYGKLNGDHVLSYFFVAEICKRNL